MTSFTAAQRVRIARQFALITRSTAWSVQGSDERSLYLTRTTAGGVAYDVTVTADGYGRLNLYVSSPLGSATQTSLTASAVAKILG